MNILNIVIPILWHFYSFVSNWSFASHIKPHVIQQNEWSQAISDSVSQDVLSQIFDVIQSNVALQKKVH